MAKYDYDMVIVGGGAAGLTVASGAAQLGARTLLIEKEKELGGDCLHFGCVPSKTLIKTAHVYHQTQNLKKFGLPAVTPPPVNFKDVADRIRRVVSKIQIHDSVERFNALGAEILFGNPEFSDEHTIICNGRRITSKKFLLATGSRASVPDVEGLNGVDYLTNQEIFYMDSLPESLIVLGAGPIAVEMAQAFNRLGSRVTVIQRSNQILSKEDQDMADIVMNGMEEEGVRFYLGCKVNSVEESDGRKKVSIAQPGQSPVVVEATDILVALGRSVNTDALGLEKIGVHFDRSGISVDKKLRTSQKHIFAAGDVIGGYQFTHSAGYEGGIVLSYAIFNIPRKVNYTWMPWCTYTGPELASIGMNEKAAAAAGKEYRLWSEDFSSSDRALAEEEPTGRIKLLIDPKGKPLGVQILGLHGGELLAEWIAVLNGKVKLSTLAGAVHPYPTLAEMNKRVVGSIFSEKLFSEKVKKALRFIFKYQGSSV